jgi:signal transduction histidine kinase
VCFVAVANPTTDLLENRSFPDLAAALRERSGLIIQRWEQAVRQLLPGADELTFAQVRDHIPEILDQLADALASDRPAAAQELREKSRSHGAVRFHQHYNVRELMVEYRLLRRILFEEIYSASEGQFTVAEMIVLDMGVDTALQQGLLAFIEHQRGQIEAATEAESKYLRFLSHDLRNNLNQVVLVLELLSRRLKGLPDFTEDLSDISSARHTIMNTITGMDALLQAERLRKGAVKPKMEPVELLATLTDVVRHGLVEARQKGLELVCECPPEAAVMGDRDLIAIVLQNLLGNAIKYSDKGTVRVIASPWKVDIGQGWTIAISDQGPGIDTHSQQRIFEAFARGQTHGQPGVGLGLTIASEAAKLLGARLTVDSQPGIGSTFRLILSTVPQA